MTEAEERLLGEMAEQPQVVRRILQQAPPAVGRVVDRLRATGPWSIVLCARGSSDNAAVYARYMLEIRARRVVSLAAPSTVTLYGSGPTLARAAVIGISQSGRGEDVVAFLKSAHEQGAVTVAVVNAPVSPLSQHADFVLELDAGEEVSVPATKTLVAEMTVMAMLAEALAGSPPSLMNGLPDALEKALQLRPQAKAFAEHLARVQTCAVVGRGFGFPAALETGLKLKEMAGVHAESFSGADFFHGPVTLIGSQHPVLLIDVGGASTAPALATAEEIHRRGGIPLLLRAGELRPSPLPYPTFQLPLRDLPEAFAPIAAVVLGQLVSYEAALLRGVSPASPRGLQKITSTL
ncbi:MAG TPA: SIS domain-containing protein [Myxococcaceae bacterium]|nr:SIS domain-containing protein [Myxococcaceae bacterium]